jgi:hypothetical protein
VLVVTKVGETIGFNLDGPLDGAIGYPPRPAQPPPRRVQELPEAGYRVQPGFDRLPDSLDPEEHARAQSRMSGPI